MTLRKGWLLLTGICLFCTSAFSQDTEHSILKFSETRHDFYSIKEADGTKSHDFLLTNVGDKKVRLLGYVSGNAAARCEWKQNVLKKNDSVRIRVILDPKGMKYSFRFPLTLTTLVEKDTIRYKIMLSGYVVPSLTAREEKYSMQEGNLKYRNNTLSFSPMHRNEVRTDTIWFLNVWDSTMRLSPGSLPPAIRIIDLTREVAPNAEGYVVFSYSAAAKNDWGNVWDKFTLQTNDPKPKERNNYKTFYIITDIYDDFSSWTGEQMKNAPHILVDSTTFDFGRCFIGDVINHEFILKNTGKSTLIIHKVKTSCGCTTSNLEKDSLAPGESTKIKARFNTYGKRGGQEKEIFVITNDPKQPKTTLKIKGKVLEKPKEQN